jgi:site-specific recombinase XerD
MITICPHVTVTEDFAKAFYYEEYYASLRIQWLTPDTREYYTRMIHQFVRFSSFTSYLDFTSFVKLKMAYYNLMGKNLWNNTIYKHYKCIKKYTDFLKNNELIDKVYITQIPKIKTTIPLPKSMSEEEVQMVREFMLRPWIHQTKFIQMRNYIIIETFLYTGLRRAELIRLKKNWVFETHILVEQGKGQKDRIVYIPKKFSQQLREFIRIQDKNDEYVFCDLQWRNLSVSAISCLFQRIEDNLKFKVTPHLMRHTYASLCVKRGINLHTLQQQMWHTSLKTTSIYLYLNNKETFEEMQKLRI